MVSLLVLMNNSLAPYVSLENVACLSLRKTCNKFKSSSSIVDAPNGTANIESNLVMRYAGSSAGKRAEALGEIGWEVKAGGLHKVPIWDFVQVVVVATRLLWLRPSLISEEESSRSTSVSLGADRQGSEKIESKRRSKFELVLRQAFVQFELVLRQAFVQFELVLRQASDREYRLGPGNWSFGKRVLEYFVSPFTTFEKNRFGKAYVYGLGFLIFGKRRAVVADSKFVRLGPFVCGVQLGFVSSYKGFKREDERVLGFARESRRGYPWLAINRNLEW
ncbi:hypothetical protein L3X38_000140 [Prunus dulcis]|uniref:Uncharacterized protein n=1 Tax=Prunus dulcis TaxID=3755 RepID=A0AAD4UPV2_PRUDU|nr:hypothetical protein L3X38_000140 [Prunus dulcis]